MNIMQVFALVATIASVASIKSSHFLVETGKAIGYETLECAKIAGGATALAVGYGIVNNQITVRICADYFTKGHLEKQVDTMFTKKKITLATRDKLLNNDNPTFIGCWWGFAATWWVGLPLGVIAAAAMRLGGLPKLTMQDVAKPALLGMAGVLLAGWANGIHTYFTQDHQILHDTSYLEDVEGADNKRLFNVDASIHNVGYLGGAVVGLGLCGYAVAKRLALSK